MSDRRDQIEISPPASENAEAPDSTFPSEPFPCPVCGQMLAPSCRVCVACRQPIDPRKIDMAQAPEGWTPDSKPQPAIAARAGVPTVRFPWLLFLAFFVLLSLAEKPLEKRWGLANTSMVFGAFELVSAIWVFFDAGHKHVVRRIRWAWGTLLLWPLVFPWYLARRKSPQSPCPFVEGIGLPIVLVIYIALTVLIVALKGPLV